MDPGYDKSMPYIKMIEQPQPEVAFVDEDTQVPYQPHEILYGVGSNNIYKTFPAIRIMNYHGYATVIVSCVTEGAPFRPHPFEIIGGTSCIRGVRAERLKPSCPNMEVVFKNLSIQRIKKSNIRESLKQRKKIKVDPFNTGYRMIREASDMKAVRLCIAVCTHGLNYENQKFLRPIITEIIRDRTYEGNNLSICKLSPANAFVDGGHKVILLCEIVPRYDIQVRFFEKRGDELIWESYGYFEPTRVHHKIAIVFFTPAYWNQHIDRPANVRIQLRRPSDNKFGEPVLFQFLPLPKVEVTPGSSVSTSPDLDVSSSENSPVFPKTNWWSNTIDSSELGACAAPLIRPLTKSENRHHSSDSQSKNVLCSDFLNIPFFNSSESPFSFYDEQPDPSPKKDGNTPTKKQEKSSKSQDMGLHRKFRELR